MDDERLGCVLLRLHDEERPHGALWNGMSWMLIKGG